jgi:hypothetical protein
VGGLSTHARAKSRWVDPARHNGSVDARCGLLAVVAHRLFLQDAVKVGKIDPKAIDFVEVAKPIPLSF